MRLKSGFTIPIPMRDSSQGRFRNGFCGSSHRQKIREFAVTTRRVNLDLLREKEEIILGFAENSKASVCTPPPSRAEMKSFILGDKADQQPSCIMQFPAEWLQQCISRNTRIHVVQKAAAYTIGT